MRTGKLWAAFRPYLWITPASAVFALGFDWCNVPNQITLGGMTGLGQIIHAIVPAIPVGSAVIALNLPLFLLGWRLLGWKLLASSLFATAATSLGVDLLAACYSFPPMDPMLASVFGGALIGLSLGMVFLQGATTGGTDLIARLLKLRFGHLPMGTLVMAVDLVVIALAALAFHSLSSALYGLVSLISPPWSSTGCSTAWTTPRWPISSATAPRRSSAPSVRSWTGASPSSGGPGPGPRRQKTCSCAPSSRSRSWP